MADFTMMIDLAAERLGGRALVANDEFFAEKENLLKASAPVFIEGKYTDRGKWMDGWESRRRRTPGFDWCIIKLGLPGVIRGVSVDTSFFRGNYPPMCSLEALDAGDDPCAEELVAPGVAWRELLPQSNLAGHSENIFEIKDGRRVTHIRLNIFPDGGVARLRIHGEVVPDWEKLLAAKEPVDLAALAHGGTIVSCSDMFFGHAPNMLQPGPSLNMGDGWETKRRRGPGHDWAIVKLAKRGVIRQVEVDTSFFKGNYPDTCDLECCDREAATREELEGTAAGWKPLVARAKLEADHRHVFDIVESARRACSHVRINIFPDGGVARLRLMGRFLREGEER